MSKADLHAEQHPLQVAVKASVDSVAGLALATPACVLVGYSGGRDSTVLLHAAVAALGPASVVAVHINHHLQQDADQWQSHTEATAHQLGCRYHCVQATPPASNPSGGIEAWARAFRRSAFAELAPELKATAVLLAHHADDQVETILLNWGRGAGPAGMTGMQQQSTIANATLLRPFLAWPADALKEYAQQFNLAWIEDPSNQDVAFRRNRVRHEVLPLLDEVFPGFRGNVLRHADLVKGQGASAVTPQGASFDRSAFASDSDPALDAMLHRWLKSLGQRTPTQARTRHLREQLFRSDAAYAQCQHDSAWLRRYRNQVEWVSQLPVPVTVETRIQWQGQTDIPLPDFGGVLELRACVPGEPGLPAECLASQVLTISSLRMNASMRVAANGRNRSLRLLCQERGIPSWQRQCLPMVSNGEIVVFAAGIGCNQALAVTAGPERWHLEFRPR